MHHETLSYEADGLPMKSELFFEAGVAGKRPGILVFPEAFGLGEHAIGRAKRLAGLGYVALACDYYGNQKNFGGLEEVMGVLGPLMQDPSHTRARAEGGLQALTARPEVDGGKIAAIGYCFGGTMALELARSGADIKGAVGFHSGLGTARPQDAKDIKGKVLVCIGSDDPMMDADTRKAFEAEMRDGKVDWQVNVYGGAVHSFTNPAADALNNPGFAKYDARADARSWAEMQNFFGEIFGKQ